jgi:hypothetical protein
VNELGLPLGRPGRCSLDDFRGRTASSLDDFFPLEVFKVAPFLSSLDNPLSELPRHPPRVISGPNLSAPSAVRRIGAVGGPSLGASLSFPLKPTPLERRRPRLMPEFNDASLTVENGGYNSVSITILDFDLCKLLDRTRLIISLVDHYRIMVEFFLRKQAASGRMARAHLYLIKCY